MKNIPVHAKVDCADGPCGDSVAVIVDPKTLKVTHFSVKTRAKAHPQLLVPVEEVMEATADSIRLRCSSEELAEMKPFTVTEYRQVEIPRYSGYGAAQPYYSPDIETLKVEKELVPDGEITIRPRMEVEATDGSVGRVHELLTDPESGQITHVVLREGHPWGKKDVIMPVSLVDMVGRDKVYLTLDKETVAAMLLAVPARWKAGTAALQLVVLIGEATGTAQDALQTLKEVARKDDVEIHNAAVLVKDVGGQATITETEDVSTRHGALFGAISGALIGLLGGPVGAVVGAAAGAAAGGAASRWIDMGFSDDYLAKLEEGLQPGSSALVVLVDPESADEVVSVLGAFEGQVLCEEITADVAAKIAGS